MAKPTARPVRSVSCCEEPGAGKPPAGICEGGTEQSVSLPQSRIEFPPCTTFDLQRDCFLISDRIGTKRLSSLCCFHFWNVINSHRAW